MRDILVQFVKYGIGGSLAFIFAFLNLYFLTERLKIYYLTSAIIAYLAGMIVNFVFQAWITFQTKRSKLSGRLLLFLIIQSFGLLLFTSFMFLLTDKLKLLYLVSYVISAFIVFLFNFSLSKYFVFSKQLLPE